MYIITTRRITSGELLKQRKGFCIQKGYGLPVTVSSQFALTTPSCVLLENYYLPGDLEATVGAFVERYNYHRYHESIANLTPADVYFGRDQTIIERRRKIKELTIQKRRLDHRRQAA